MRDENNVVTAMTSKKNKNNKTEFNIVYEAFERQILGAEWNHKFREIKTHSLFHLVFRVHGLIELKAIHSHYKRPASNQTKRSETKNGEERRKKTQMIRNRKTVCTTGAIKG